jgi:hypothetical protein
MNTLQTGHRNRTVFEEFREKLSYSLEANYDIVSWQMGQLLAETNQLGKCPLILLDTI